jgi:colicin import membrane protein
MGRFSALMLALLLGAVSAVALSSCGGGSDAKLLPGTTASQIESNLEEVQQLAASGDCIGAEDAVAEVSAEVEEVNVAAKLKAALQEGTEKLSEVVGRCEEETEEEEAEPSRQADVEAEELEAEELEAEDKAAKAQEKAEKQEQKEEEKETGPEVEEGKLPPQSEGKGKAKGHEEAPPPGPEPAPAPESGEAESGGVSPGVGVE